MNNMIHGQNLSSTSGEPEFVAHFFFDAQASEGRVGGERNNVHQSGSHPTLYPGRTM
jgi:hypothetical protein